MIARSARRPRRQNLFDHAAKCINKCDLGQLDAILLAGFVFAVGCGIITFLFVLGAIQSFTAHSPDAKAAALTAAQLPQMRVLYAPAPAANSPAAASFQADADCARFGRPRPIAHYAGAFAAADEQQPGQVQASASSTY